MSSTLADGLVILHLGFVLFVALGALLVLRWPRAVWLHVPAVAWGVTVEWLGWICPLTPLENQLRAAGGEAAYEGDFVANYVLPVLYPEGLTREAQILVGAAALVLNVAIYAVAGARARPARFSIARYAWAFPNTAFGLLLTPAALLRGGRIRVVDGVIEMHGPAVAALLRCAMPLQGGAAAITFGHVVLARDARTMEMTRAHERVHVRQCETLGPAFVPAYLAASAWAFTRGAGAYWGNHFEQQARREADLPHA